MPVAFLLAVVATLYPQSRLCAFVSPHPAQYYERGMEAIHRYRGQSDQLAQAYKNFSALIKKFPDSALGYLGLSRLTIIQAYRFDNYYHMETIRNEAFPLTLKALELNPLLPAVHIQYSTIEDIFANHQQSQELAQKYLRLLPEEPETFYFLGVYLYSQEDYDKSVKFFKTALELNPDPALEIAIAKRLGLIYLTHYDKPKEAIGYYQRAAALTPDDPVINEYLGRAYVADHDYALAVGQLEQSVRAIENPMAEYYLSLARGFWLQAEGRVSKAIFYLEKATSYAKPNSQLHYHLGNLYFRMNDYARAFQHFKQVIALKPQDFSDAYYFAGRSAHSLGDEISAARYFKKYLQVNGTGKEAEWIREQFPSLSQK